MSLEGKKVEVDALLAAKTACDMKDLFGIVSGQMKDTMDYVKAHSEEFSAKQFVEMSKAVFALIGYKHTMGQFAEAVAKEVERIEQGQKEEKGE